MSFPEKSLLVCAPDYYDVVYEINAWMSVKDRPQYNLAKEQWQKYRSTLESLNYNLYYLQPQTGVPDLVFTANHGLVKGKKAVLAKMKYPERQLEFNHYKKWFLDNGFELYEPVSGYYEGEGDSFIIGDTLFYGYGFRSDRQVAEEIKDFFSLKKIVYVSLTDPYFYHFDTCFAPLGNNKAMLHEAAISPESLAEIKKDLEIISISKEDARKFCCNAVVAGSDIVLPADCPEAYRKLSEHGFNLHAVDLNQYLKAGGAAKCLCLRLWN